MPFGIKLHKYKNKYQFTIELNALPSNMSILSHRFQHLMTRYLKITFIFFPPDKIDAKIHNTIQYFTNYS